jgi:hypothetical protein
MKTQRRSLQFDCLEGKVLLSVGMADPASTVYRAASATFRLNGSLFGVPISTGSSNGTDVSSFTLKGTLASMGRVKGTFALADAFNYGGQPNLSNARLTLSNRKGSVAIQIGMSSTNFYDYIITSGSGRFASASGSGIVALHLSRRVYGLVIVVLHSNPH